MRIVIDATAAGGGGKVYLDHLLTHLAQLSDGREFVIFHTGAFDAFAKSNADSRLRFRRVSLPLLDWWAGAGILKLMWRLIVLPIHLLRLQPALLFSNAGFGPGWKSASIKTVLAIHNSMPLRADLIAEEPSIPRRLRLRLLRRLMRRSLRDCDGAIVFSQDTKRRLIESFGELKCDPAVVYNGIDWGERERRMNGRGRFELETPYLLYVSHFHRYKNLLRLIEAFAVLAERRGDLSLALVGEPADRDYWREVEMRAAQLGIRHRIKHIPNCPRDELIAIYRNALLFVHPSLAEACSFPLLEAMAMRLPIAAARMSALPEMAADAALYFDPHDTGEMAAVLEQLIYDEALRRELGNRAMRRAADFSWTETARETMAVFERVAGFDESETALLERQENAEHAE